jgi:hypothetical protein
MNDSTAKTRRRRKVESIDAEVGDMARKMIAETSSLVAPSRSPSSRTYELLDAIFQIDELQRQVWVELQKERYMELRQNTKGIPR